MWGCGVHRIESNIVRVRKNCGHAQYRFSDSTFIILKFSLDPWAFVACAEQFLRTFVKFQHRSMSFFWFSEVIFLWGVLAGPVGPQPDKVCL